MNELLTINVNDKTEKKGGLTYLSWAWAWSQVLAIDPNATWEPVLYGVPGREQPCMWIGETAMVHTIVTIKGVKRECLLPVMDNRNNAVKNPDSRKISDAIMRCMTKAIGMHGLGLYIYAGEDLPIADEPPAEPPQKAQKTLGKANPAQLMAEECMAHASVARLKELDELAAYLVELHTSGQEVEAIALFYAEDTWTRDIEMRPLEQSYVWNSLKDYSKFRATLKANKPQEQPA